MSELFARDTNAEAHAGRRKIVSRGEATEAHVGIIRSVGVFVNTQTTSVANIFVRIALCCRDTVGIDVL